MSTANNILPHGSNQPLNSGPRDRNSRSVLRLRVQVSLVGTDISGQQFRETTGTELVSPCGAVVDSVQSLRSGQQLVLEFAGKTTPARIVGQAGINERGHSYGVVFAKSDPLFWGISFPNRTVGHELMLECCRCRQWLSTCINEVEAIVLRANARLHLSCSNCKGEQLWKLVRSPILLEQLAPANSDVSVSHDSRMDPEVEPEPDLVPIASIVDNDLFRPARPERRRHKRVSLSQAKACIEKPGHEMDIADVVNVSRTGACVRTTKEYPIGCWIRVACPYTIAGSNIFQSARIVRVTELSGAREYGIEYVRLT